MSRTSAASPRRSRAGLGIAALAMGLALACGGERETPPEAAPPAEAPAPPPAGAPAPPPAAAPPSAAAPGAPADAATLARLEALYEWDPGAGAPRDLKSDTVECMSKVTAQGLPGVAEHIECMRGLGWKTVDPQS